MGLIALIFTVIWICTHDYTKNPRTGEDKKEKIDDFLIKNKGGLKK